MVEDNQTTEKAKETDASFSALRKKIVARASPAPLTQAVAITARTAPEPSTEALLKQVEAIKRPSRPPILGVREVPHKAKHARGGRQKEVVNPLLDARKARQAKSLKQLKKSTMMKPPGHRSARPNRHTSKQTKVERYTVV